VSRDNEIPLISQRLGHIDGDMDTHMDGTAADDQSGGLRF